jgi:translocation and assembly module TamB
MRRAGRVLLTGGGIALGIAALLFAIAIYTLRTEWFKQRVRETIVAAAERATGGRVELGAFRYDWRSLDAEFDGFVVHGSELAGAAPLFRAPAIRVGLRIVSLLRRDVDIRFLRIERPQICVLVRPDGTTNIPRAAMGGGSGLVNELFSLRVDRFEIQDGVVQVDAQRFPLQVRGEDLKLLLRDEPKAPQYRVSMAVRRLESDWGWLRGLSGDVNARLRLERDRVLVDQFVLSGAGARFEARGGLRQFANPVADLNVQAKMDARYAAVMAQMPGLEAGQMALNGAVHYEAGTGANFRGEVSGKEVTYRINGRTLRGIDFNSAVEAHEGELEFRDAHMAVLGMRLEGNGAVKETREWQFAGRFSGLSLREVGAVRGYSLPSGGVAAGPFHATGKLGTQMLAVESRVQIAPTVAGVPVSGTLDISYRQPGETWAFGDSQLNLQHTRVAFSGVLGQSLRLTLDSTDLDDLAGSHITDLAVRNGNVHFDGTVSGSLATTYAQGNLTAAGLAFRNLLWRQVRARVEAAEGGVDFSGLTADSVAMHLVGGGHIGLTGWRMTAGSPIRLQAKFQGADLARISSSFLPGKLQPFEGIGTGSVNLAGSIGEPRGSVDVHIDNLDAYGQRLNTIQVEANIEGDRVEITQGKMRSGAALLSFSGAYRRSEPSWQTGVLSLKADSNGFPLASLAVVRRSEPGLQGVMEIHGQATARITPERVEPEQADGTVTIRDIAADGIPYGSVEAGVATRGDLMEARFSGDLRETKLSGRAEVQLAAGLPSSGEVHLDRMRIGTLYALAIPGRKAEAPLDGFVQGGFTFSGPLEHFDAMRATVQLRQLELRSKLPVAGENRGSETADLLFRNSGPILLEAANGLATIRSLDIEGKDTALSVRGTIPYVRERPIDLNIGGSADLRLLRLFDPDMQSDGQSSLAASVTGTFTNPAISGTLKLKNGSFFLKDVPNGLTDVNGRVDFDRDRATLQNLTAQTGGGTVSLTGFVTYGGAGPLVYSVGGNAENVRMRYAGGSITSDAKLQLTGTSKNSMLSGTVTVSRVAFNANTDVGTLAASLAAPAPANEQDFLTGLQLDVRVENAPNMQLSTALSRDVEAEIDLRLRGTVNHPVVLGTVAVNQGDIKVFGTKYSINRAVVSFNNPVKIEPVLDLDLQTRARGVVVDITIAGTPGKLNINYRSDPPLQPRDIIALLTVGRAPDSPENVPSTTANDVSALQPGANTVLGAAVAPSSSRLQKLFGVANIKIDPLVQGITNTMQRLTIEQQISRDITVTYVTNLSQTSEQIFRFEWALSQQYSLVALRDDNGEFGIDIQYKKRFK